jgi:endo-cleaving rubber dioxygenase
MRHDSRRRLGGAMGVLAAIAIAGCAGDYSGDAGGGNGGPSPGGGSFSGPEDFYAKRVEPRLAFCRTCHVPGGVADVDDGRLLMLGPQPGNDYALLRASWEALGGNNPESRILLMASGRDTRSHSGGTPWPLGSAAYADMKTLLGCFESPAGCLDSAGGAPVTEDAPLLGSSRGGHAWFDFCEGKADGVQLPPDPRALVVPGANQDKAVYFNAYWKDCHLDPALVGEEPPPQTCGELHAFHARGKTLIEGNGAIGAGWYFGGNGTEGNLSAAEFNTLWERWGLPARPDNFDTLVAERYGMGMGTARNPYPLPGEDPNLTDGGSGQLPTGLTQLRAADGRWTGNLGVTCHVCHSGQIGLPGQPADALYGNGNSLSEFGQIDVDLGRGVVPGVPLPIPLVVGKTRGTNNALALQIITFLVAGDIRPLDPNFLEFALLTPNGGSLDTPAWWNMGSRPVKFQDGFLAMDALRSDLGFYLPGPGPGGFDWVREHVRAGDTYIMSLKAPAYPGPVDSALAEQGAVLFHAKDLWAPELSNPVPRPDGGNGSCASCHGAYAPRYVNDPAYLDTPALAGVASYIVPRDLIGTDRWRVDSDNEAAEQYGKENFFAYPETLNPDPNLDCSTQNRAEIRQGRAYGYLAPPLHGVWASAPYFHNGSVPNVWEVLKPADRKPLWRRMSTPARPDQLGQVVMGFDTDFNRAYDRERLGWQYEALTCGDGGTTPYLDCSPNDTDPTLLTLINILNSSNPYLWYLGFGPTSDAQLESRKIYNTRMYGQGNGGHDFTAVLTDAERRALIEYLKTL